MDNISVIEILRQAEASLFPAVGSGELVALLQRSRRELSLDPPEDYMAFLRQSDGAVADGLMLYGVEPHQVDGGDVPALIDINLRRRAYREDLNLFLQLGEMDDDFIGFHSGLRRYWRVDRTSGECQEEQANFHDLVERLVLRH